MNFQIKLNHKSNFKSQIRFQITNYVQITNRFQIMYRFSKGVASLPHIIMNPLNVEGFYAAMHVQTIIV